MHACCGLGLSPTSHCEASLLAVHVPSKTSSVMVSSLALLIHVERYSYGRRMARSANSRIIPTVPCCCHTSGRTSSPSCSSPSPQTARNSEGNVRATRRYSRLHTVTQLLTCAPPGCVELREGERGP